MGGIRIFSGTTHCTSPVVWPPWNACAQPHHQSNFRQPWVAVWAFLDLISMAEQILPKVGFLLTYLGNNKVVTEVTFVLQNSEQI